jgi:hypothetical protein
MKKHSNSLKQRDCPAKRRKLDGIEIIGAPTSGIRRDPLERLYAFHETQAAQAILRLARLFFSSSLHTNILVCAVIGIKELRTAKHDPGSEDRTKRTQPKERSGLCLNPPT